MLLKNPYKLKLNEICSNKNCEILELVTKSICCISVHEVFKKRIYHLDQKNELWRKEQVLWMTFRIPSPLLLVFCYVFLKKNQFSLQKLKNGENRELHKEKKITHNLTRGNHSCGFFLQSFSKVCVCACANACNILCLIGVILDIPFWSLYFHLLDLKHFTV